jgi:hypothetical protein
VLPVLRDMAFKWASSEAHSFVADSVPPERNPWPIFYTLEIGVPCLRALQSSLGSLGTTWFRFHHREWDSNSSGLEDLVTDPLGRQRR